MNNLSETYHLISWDLDLEMRQFGYHIHQTQEMTWERALALNRNLTRSLGSLCWRAADTLDPDQLLKESGPDLEPEWDDTTDLRPPGHTRSESESSAG